MRGRIIALLALLAVLVPAAPAVAGNGGGPPPPPSGDSSTIQSQVQLTVNSPGGTQHLTAADTSWTPPPCWFEPRFTPDQYQVYWETVILPAAGSFMQYVAPEYDKLKAINFNKGQPGLWWGLVFADKAWNLGGYQECFQKSGEIWVPPAGPPAGVPAVSPKTLSEIAYAATKLPDVSLSLSPAADKQVVNLPTYVKFSSALAPVSVVAQLNVLGVSVAASTLAVPVSLQVDGGSDNASPRTCTYPMVNQGGTYQVDSSSAGCNVTYRRASNGSQYPLTGKVTWRVTWSASADPNGPVAGTLPDGTSGSTPNPVTVNEIQTVVTG